MLCFDRSNRQQLWNACTQTIYPIELKYICYSLLIIITIIIFCLSYKMEQKEFSNAHRSIMSKWESKMRNKCNRHKQIFKWNMFGWFSLLLIPPILHFSLIFWFVFSWFSVLIQIEKTKIQKMLELESPRKRNSKNRWHTANLNVCYSFKCQKKLYRLLYFKLISLSVSLSFISFSIFWFSMPARW